MDGEGDAGVAHAHHVLCDARQREAVVLTRHVHQRQVDGMYVGPVQIRLKPQQKENNQRFLHGRLSPNPTELREAKGKQSRRGRRPFRGKRAGRGPGPVQSRAQAMLTCPRRGQRRHDTHFTGAETKRQRGFLARLGSSRLESTVAGWNPSLRVSSWRVRTTNFLSSSFSRLLLLFMI